MNNPQQLRERKDDKRVLVERVTKAGSDKHEGHEDWQQGNCDCDGVFDFSEVLDLIKQD